MTKTLNNSHDVAKNNFYQFVI